MDYSSDDSLKDPNSLLMKEICPLASVRKKIPKTQKTQTENDQYTKKGEVRKQRRFEQSVAKRKILKREEIILKYAIKPNCKTSCKKKCTFSLSTGQQYL